MSRFVVIALLADALAPLALAQVAPSPVSASTPMAPAAGVDARSTNTNLVNRFKLDPGDEVVIPKISRAKATDFKLDTNNLVALKQDGISKGVVRRMPKRATLASQRRSEE